MGRGRGEGEEHEQGRSLDELREHLREALAEPDVTDRMLEVSAVITEAVAEFKVEPILVGGMAVAYWTRGEFDTGDMEFVAPRLPEVKQRFEDLGFIVEGRHWVYPGSDVAFEIPDESLDPGDKAEYVTTKRGHRVRVISLEDMVLWRLREFLHWKQARGFHQALYLLGNPRLDEERLDQRAAEEGLTDALQAVREGKKRIEAGEALDDLEIRETAQRLSHPPRMGT